VNFVSIAVLLLASFSFSGQAQNADPGLQVRSEIPEALAGFPGATAEWWAAAQAQISQAVGEQPGLSPIPDWSAFGESPGDIFGVIVASAGDVNGDGYTDLAVSAHGYSSNTGKVYVFHGSASGLSNAPEWSAVGDTTGILFGNSLASAGDVNGDGYADLAVGATGYSSGTGKEYVYYGSAVGLSASPDWTAVGETVDSFFGIAASARDVNSDGFADLVIGAPGYPFSNFTGKAYVYHGSATGLSASPDWVTVGENLSGYGTSVASAGDVNGDGYADLVVGADAYSDGLGKAYVYHGSATGLSASPDWVAVGENLSGFGAWVAPAGDVNGDSYADLAIGATYYNSSTGKAYVFHGSASGLSASADWSAIGEAEENYFTWQLSSGGDLDGDGYDDLVIGAPGYDTGNFVGKAYVYQGSAVGLSVNADWSATGEAEFNNFGESVTSAGDVNGDGYEDLAIGAPGINDFSGKAFVFHGSAIPAGCTSNCLRVTAIRFRPDLSSLIAVVAIRDENGAAVPGAAVSVRWDLPGGGVLEQVKNTDASGSASFRVKGGSGTYTITITDAILAGYTFDPLNSTILSKSISK
jgi:hypothetical protein